MDTVKGALGAAYPLPSDEAAIAAGDAFNVWEITGAGEPGPHDLGPVRDAEFDEAFAAADVGADFADADDYAAFDRVVEAAGPWALVVVLVLLAGVVLGCGFAVWTLVEWVRR